MRPLFLCLLLAATALLGGVSCGKKTAGANPVNDTAFQSASAEVKGKWEKALAASKAKDYLGGTVMLMQLREETSLTPDQRTAIDATMTALQDSMYEALNRGDAKAKEAMESLRKIRAR